LKNGNVLSVDREPYHKTGVGKKNFEFKEEEK